jgi:hypothetical protein
MGLACGDLRAPRPHGVALRGVGPRSRTIHVTGNGDAEAVVATEREYCAEFESAGLLDGRETQSLAPRSENAREKTREKYGPVGGDRVYALRRIAADATVALLAAFDAPLPVIGDPTDENPVPSGHWSTVHYLVKPLGYDRDQEIDACSQAIRTRLVSLALFTPTSSHGRGSTRCSPTWGPAGIGSGSEPHAR